MQCALAWYTGAFADRERQLGVEILLDALLSTNSSPLKAALLAEKLGADIDIGFDDSTLQPTCWSWCCAVPRWIPPANLPPLYARLWTAF